jgi:hypothetical protein
MPILESQIVEHLQNYALRKISLDEFVEWFVPISIRIDQSHDDEAIELAHRIDGVLSEASSASWSEGDIHEELARPFVSHPVAEEIDVFGDPDLFFSVAQSSAANVCVSA